MSTVTERRTTATRFFWVVLGTATASSIAGNVTHAITTAERGSVVVAAAAAVVPPVVLLAATHGLALMVRTGIGGGLYRAALALTAALGGCALVLSFHALYELAVDEAGIPAAIAWLWPLAVDLSITQATLALLALTTGHRARREAAEAERIPRPRRRAAPAKRPALKRVA